MKIKILTLFAVIFGLLLLAGCGGSGGGSGSTGVGTLSLRMADAPAPNVSALDVTISRIEANINGTWTAVVTTPQTLNLISLAKVDTGLGSANLPAGSYTQIRLFVSSATVTDNTGTYPVTIPSGAQTGIKLNVDYTIGADAVTELLLDFNVNRSLVRQGNGKYLLQPVIPVVVDVLSGTITGTASDGTNTLAGATVTATYESGSSYAVGTVVDTSDTLADGTFKLWALLPGTYNLSFSYTDSQTNTTKTATVTGVVVIANQNTDVGTVTLT